MHEQLAEGAARLASEAREFAICHGILRYREGRIAHLPLTLLPCWLPRAFVEQGRQATLVFNRLYHAVATQRDFLEEQLGAALAGDEFLRRLHDCWPRTAPLKPILYLTRNDFMPAWNDGHCSARQVEANLIAASLGVMSERVTALVRHLYQGQSWLKDLLPNHSGTNLANAMGRVFQRYRQGDSQMLFIIPAGEANAFDQLGLLSRLRIEFEVPAVRTSLQELGQLGELRGGDLYFRGRRVTLVYFRAGYTPDHYPDPECWQARRLIEESSAISVPSVATQLVNSKKMQQILAQPEILRRFVEEEEARLLLEAQMVLAGVDQEIEWRGQRAPARQHALSHPEAWVLKPSREGGGNNYFGQELAHQLRQLSPASASSYILMETIQQRPFRGIRLSQDQVLDSPCLTEMGHYTACCLEPGSSEPVFNELLGTLLRSKDCTSQEAFVLGDHSYLDAPVLF